MTLQKSTHEHLLAHHRDFDQFVENMVETHSSRFDEVFWAFLEEYAPPLLGRVVDLGTGPGLLLAELHRRFATAEVWGVEAQPAMVKRAEQEVLQCGNKVHLVRHDLSLPGIPGLKDASVDLVLASMLLHEMELPLVVMEEVSRILKPGGLWLVYDWVRMPLERYAEGRIPRTRDEVMHFSEHCRYTAEDWVWMLKTTGFEVPEWVLRHDGRHVLAAAIRK